MITGRPMKTWAVAALAPTLAARLGVTLPAATGKDLLPAAQRR